MSVFGLDPRVERHLIADEGEVIVDEVAKHWAAKVGCALEMLAAIPALMLIMVLPKQLYFVPLLGALALLLHGFWRFVGLRMDRFVITNMRVFRVHGILSQRIATMPLSRILDISVHVPFIGRILGYGHFVFESAAQDQGLREIRFVGRPDERGLTIQRVIQRAGLRGRTAQPGVPAGYDDGTAGPEGGVGGRASVGAGAGGAAEVGATSQFERWREERQASAATEPVPVVRVADDRGADASGAGGADGDEHDTAEMPW
ncbi:PH domain-containing protein [Agromyces soli]